MARKKQEELKELTLNKDLTINEEYKNIITTAERGRYTYFDFTKEKLQEIVNKNVDELRNSDAFPLVQALFPKYLICSGLFDKFLMFEIKNGVRVDPPKYCYTNVESYLDNNKEKKFNLLILEIKDLLDKNGIVWHTSWDEMYKEIMKEKGR